MPSETGIKTAVKYGTILEIADFELALLRGRLPQTTSFKGEDQTPLQNSRRGWGNKIDRAELVLKEERGRD